MLFFNRFAINLLIINNVFQYLSTLDSSMVIRKIYSNLRADLDFIAFPFSFNFSYFIFSIPMAFLITFAITKFGKFNFKDSSVEEITLNILKIGLINIVITLSFIFFFQFYELLSRLYVFIYIFLFPIIIFLIEYLIEAFIKIRYQIYLQISFFLFLSFLVFNQYSNSFAEESYSSNSIEEIVLQTRSEVKSYSVEDAKCQDWLGSALKVNCIGGVEVLSETFQGQISNLVVHNKSIYYIFKNGLIYHQKNSESELELFLDISDRVFTDFIGMSQGLYSFAFHPSQNYILLTYSNNDIALVVEKFYIEGSKPVKNGSEILLKVSNNIKLHFGGSIIWSEFFNGFLIGIGDMRENIIPLVHSDAINTGSYKGKIILLDNDSKIQSPHISENIFHQPLQNIVAFGLRNPWQLLEYNNKLLVTDIGSQFIEELHLLDYDDLSEPHKSVSFGWPLLMGDKKSSEYPERNIDALTKEDGAYSDLYHFENGNQVKADSFIFENSLSPLLYYDHYVNENTIRAAIIGGDIIRDADSPYKDIYFFTDFIENELYGYDLNNNELYIFPLPQISNPTSLRVDPFNSNSLIISFVNGTLARLQLP